MGSDRQFVLCLLLISPSPHLPHLHLYPFPKKLPDKMSAVTDKLSAGFVMFCFRNHLPARPHPVNPFCRSHLSIPTGS